MAEDTPAGWDKCADWDLRVRRSAFIGRCCVLNDALPAHLAWQTSPCPACAIWICTRT